MSSVETGTSAALTHAMLGTMPLDQLIAEAEILSVSGRTLDAIKLYRVWLDATPSPMAYAVWFNLGVISASINQSLAAEEAYLNAIAQHPEFIPARLNLGTVLELLGRTEEALENWAKILDLEASVLALSPEYHTQTLNNLGRLLEILKRYDEAEARLAESLAIMHNQPDVRQHWIHLRQKQCKWPVNSGPFAMSGSAFMSSGSALSTLSLSDSFEVQLNAARRFVEKKIRKATEFLAAQEGYNHERLRIGYVSSDFCLHPASLLTVEVFEKHDREKFEVFGFCHSPEDGSDIRKRVISAFDHFHVIKNMSDEAAAKLIRSLEIDILIDLQGLTSGVRPDIFTYRPARVQVTWLGFPGTTGHPDIDYVLSDAAVIPLGSEHGYTEKPLRLPFCFQPSDNMRVVGQTPTRAECGLREDAFVFCCFNNNYKFTPEIFTSWMRILARTPGGVLWLLADNQWSKANLLLEAERHGIDTNRLIFAGRVAPPDYLARYQLADLFLDTFPFNAGTTANDALWMGLPVLTLAGESFASRMAASLLDALGQPDFVTHSVTQYEDLAVEWAQNRDTLSTRREALLKARTASRLYDMTHFVTDLEVALTSTISDISVDRAALQPVQKKIFLQFNPGGTATAETLPLFKAAGWAPAEGGNTPHIENYRGKTVNAIFLNQYLPCRFAHDVQKTLQRCLATLDDNGFVIATCPDLVTIAHGIINNGLTKPSYISEAGPITPLDMMFGHRQTINDGQENLAHHTGFTQESLVANLTEAGFKSVRALTRPDQFEVIAVATKSETDDQTFTDLLRQIFQ